MAVVINTTCVCIVGDKIIVLLETVHYTHLIAISMQ